ncbi:DUF445 domain-containing protein [Thalassotalea ponticola]|uniref:DUF445 domain-containing protein n=1 Tax=Thalassotalea ponticola TaxID=1523392 RepID=UPI0025B53F0C|nr:DUF445 domain-containing protein [Thalassotalea ponticola]MDN3652376.1 DUF445 domain-containing protein [Thalassotalea ponticola]
MNKSLITNTLALTATVAGYVLANDIVFYVGLFALSGAVTNSLAIHMLFEKVPLLYGSGVIPARFEEFKAGIRDLMMTQFFTEQNIDRFLSEKDGRASDFDLANIIAKVDLEPAFDSLVKTIEESQFASMLAMFGGSQALQPLKQKFIDKMKTSLVEISSSDSFHEMVRAELEQPDVIASVRDKVEAIVNKRLDELTPQLVKQIIQDMIKKHLGWLVVWGGVFGGLIGLISALLI